ncbi:MAG: NAD+ synthase [Acidobacteria bacterium]|nr:NAD+ synthase [Acidobacteriota bacterium]
MRIALAQINTTVGDFGANRAKIFDYARRAAEAGARVVLFPELCLTGYPPRDLVEKPSFLARAEAEVALIAAETADLALHLIIGSVAPSHQAAGKKVLNTAVVLYQGREVFRQTKMLLPTYDVFDEGRYFYSAESQSLLLIDGTPVALTVCEDTWNQKQIFAQPLYDRDPISELKAQGARLLLSINASPFEIGKRDLRRELFRTIARQHGLPCVYVNSVGGNDHLVFDGSSFAMDASGELIAESPSFAENLSYCDLDTSVGDRAASHPDEIEAAYEALVVGTRDYVTKCGFKRVLIGLSGGIDSSIVACIAVEAFGRENVMGVGMPGPYSSDHSLTDAREMAERLGIRFEVSSITPGYNTMVETLRPLFEGYQPDATEENIQSRLRGLTLMALSNKYGALVLTTGNKSELAVGYCTLYGDMCGGLAVISDVPKTMVYDLCRVANRRLSDPIPENVFIKPPSAELRPDQTDQDSLPPYDVLDRILKGYIERFESPSEIAKREDLPLDLVREIARKVDLNEYKRQQAAPGLKVTSKAFGMGRRFPIAQRYRE